MSALSCCCGQMRRQQRFPPFCPSTWPLPESWAFFNRRQDGCRDFAPKPQVLSAKPGYGRARTPGSRPILTQGHLSTLISSSAKPLKNGKSLRSVAMYLLHGSIAGKRYCANAALHHIFITTKRETDRTEKKRKQTMMQQLATQARTGALGLDVARLVTAAREAWQRRRLYNETYAQLNALSTLELADLGISRSMISRLAHEAAQRGEAGYANRH